MLKVFAAGFVACTLGTLAGLAYSQNTARSDLQVSGNFIVTGRVASLEYVASGAMATVVADKRAALSEGWVILLDDMRCIPRDKVIELRFVVEK